MCNENIRTQGECEPYTLLDGPLSATLTMDPLSPVLSGTVVIVAIYSCGVALLALYGLARYFSSRRAQANGPGPHQPLDHWWQPPNPMPLWSGEEGLRAARRRAARNAVAQIQAQPRMIAAADPLPAGLVAELRAAHDADPNQMIDGIRLADIR